MNAAPDAPSGLSLISPSSSPGYTDTPTIRVAGVKSGDTVKLFRSMDCTNQIGSGLSSGTTIDITTSSLNTGVYNIYANSTKANASACSATSVSYTRLACDAGYVLSGNTCVLSYTGISSVSNKTDSTITLNWPTHPAAASYEVYNGVTLLTSVAGQASSSTNLTGLTPSSTYQFIVRVKDASNQVDTNTNTLSATMNAAPNVPSSLSFPFYAASTATTGLMKNVVVTVAGTKAGDTIKLYTDSSCTSFLNSATATGSTVEITTGNLAAGTYHLYATATKANSSSCSTATASYTLASCPANYVAVYHNTAVETYNDFCVAKYEMKPTTAPSTGPPLSVAAGTPWVSITAANAKTQCTTNIGAKYKLMTNPEWMTTARDIEVQPSNWQTSIPENGALARGHTDLAPNSLLEASTDDNPYYGTGDTAATKWNQKRTHVLSSGDTLWDFGGNAEEKIDWSTSYAQRAYVSTDHGPIGGGGTQDFREYILLDSNICPTCYMKPSTWQPANSTLTDAANGIGKYESSSASSTTTWALRGSGGGIYGLSFNYQDWVRASAGFRCVYHP